MIFTEQRKRKDQRHICKTDIRLVMNNGVIEEMGAHDVLIGKRGLYYNLYSIHKKIHETDQ